eukprot:m.687368 g.687368  ORF g.687368 m.687368 type:complete len:73 (+) comp58627_c0_seq20:1649-1867(+)
MPGSEGSLTSRRELTDTEGWVPEIEIVVHRLCHALELEPAIFFGSDQQLGAETSVLSQVDAKLCQETKRAST